MTWKNFALSAALLAALTTPVLTQNLDADLQRAKQRAATSGDCKSVLTEYARITEQGVKSNRAVAAEALLQTGLCHESLGDGQATGIFERLAGQFRDLPQGVAARKKLAGAARPESDKKGAAGSDNGRRFVSGDEGWLSSDGAWLASRREFDLVVKNVKSGARRTLVAAPSANEGVCTDVRQPLVWARDGRRLAYLWCFHPTNDPQRRRWLEDGAEDGWEGRELRLTSTDGNAPRTVMSKKQTEVFGFTGWDRGLVDWSPDGLSVLLAAREDPTKDVFGLLDVRDSTLRWLRPGRVRHDLPGDGRFSPDGKAIAYTRRKATPPGNDVYLLPVEGGDAVPLLKDRSDSLLIDWTPNGRGLVFLSDRSGTYDVGLVHVENRRPVDLPVWLLRDVGPIGFGALTATGALYYRINAGTIYGTSSINLGDVFLVSTDPVTGKVLSQPASVRQRPGHTARPVWSQDGRLAFKSGPGGTILPDLSILSVDTGVERVLDTRLTSPRYDWSPDGRYFLQGRGTLQLVDAETGQATAIGRGGELARFFPDGASVVFRVGQNRLARLNLSTKSVEPFVTLDDDVSVGSYAIAPDGHTVAVIGHDWSKKKRDIRVMTLADGKIQSLIAIDAGGAPDDRVAWSHDSRFVIYADATSNDLVPGTATRRSELWRIAAAGGKPERLGLTFDDIRQIAVAPNGRHIAFHFERELRAGLWVMDKLLPASEQKGGR